LRRHRALSDRRRNSPVKTRQRLATRFMARSDKCNRRRPERKDLDF
jgi:hypothetical protein